jgi:hypothetical protein
VQPIYYPFLLHAHSALDLGVDVHVDGPVTDLPVPDDSHRRSYRIQDLGPFTLVDAAATSDIPRRQLAITLINRNPDASETTEVIIRDAVFAGPARIRILTQGRGAVDPAFPDILQTDLEETAETPKGSAVTIELPPQSVTTVTAPIR